MSKDTDDPTVRELKVPDLPKAVANPLITVWECVILEGEELITVDLRRVTLGKTIVIEVRDEWLSSVD